MSRGRQQQLAHHDDPQELAFLIGDVAIGDKRLLDKLAQLLHRLRDREVRAEDGDRWLHQPAHAPFGIRLVADQLLATFRRARQQDGLPAVLLESQQDVQRVGGAEHHQHLRDHRVGHLVQKFDRIIRGALRYLDRQLLELILIGLVRSGG